MGKKGDKIIRVKVTSPIVIRDMGGKSVTFYRMESVFDNIEKGPYVIVNYRRFNDFVGLQSALEDHFEGDHIKEMLPSPPPKEISLFVNHSSAEFINKRKGKLQDYIKELLKLPRVCNTKVLLNFLGWYPHDIREVSLLLKKTQMGAKLKDTRGKGDIPAKVGSFIKSKSGKSGEIESTGEVSVNDLLCRVNGEMTGGMSYEDVLRNIKLSDRPIILSFLGINLYYGVDGISKVNGAKSTIVKAKGGGESDDEESGNDDDDDSEDSGSHHKKKSKKSSKKKQVSDDDDDMDDDIKDDDDDDDSPPPPPSHKSKAKTKSKHQISKKKHHDSDEDDDVEDDDDDDEINSDAESDDAKVTKSKHKHRTHKSKKQRPVDNKSDDDLDEEDDEDDRKHKKKSSHKSKHKSDKSGSSKKTHDDDDDYDDLTV